MIAYILNRDVLPPSQDLVVRHLIRGEDVQGGGNDDDEAAPDPDALQALATVGTVKVANKGLGHQCRISIAQEP